MADEEMVEKSSEEEQSGSSGPMISTKGWIVVFTLVIGEAVFFFLLLHFRGTDEGGKKEVAGRSEVMEAKKVGSYKVSLADLNYSVMTTTQMATLSMNIDIILGRTEDERADPNAPLPDEPVMNAYVEAVKSLEPFIRDYMQSIVDNMTIQQLLKPEGKQIIKSKVRTYVNDRLRNLTFEEEDDERGGDRVTEVTISQFILQR